MGKIGRNLKCNLGQRPRMHLESSWQPRVAAAATTILDLKLISQNGGDFATISGDSLKASSFYFCEGQTVKSHTKRNAVNLKGQ
eukprot:861074-Pleurochrysis_carterae.AAC.1